jgi:hypothetical protein
MKFVQPFSSFLNESTTDWRDFKSWKILEKFGYKVIEENKRGNLYIENKNGVRYVLTPTGYIRDPLRYGTSNSIVENYTHLIKSLNIFEVFFRYFLNRDIEEIRLFPSLYSDARKEIDALLAFYMKEPLLTPIQNEFLASYVDGDWRYDSTTGLVNIEGDLTPIKKKNPIISSKRFNLKTLEGLRFGNVSGNFRLNSQGSFPTKKFPVKSLDNLVQKVEGGFFCYELGITTLDGSPKFVGGDFDCRYNQLTSLEGAPQHIGGEFICDGFTIDRGKWNFEGWLEVFLYGSEKAKSLIVTLIGPDAINKEIEKNPEEMLMRLKGIWNSPDFANIKKGIKIPEKYKGEIGTLADLNNLGF